MNLSRGVQSQPRLRGISHIVIEVSDIEAAHGFYAPILGLRDGPDAGWPVAGEYAYALASGQRLVFAASGSPRACPDSGVHQAYRCASSAIPEIKSRLAESGIPVARYHEDRPRESDGGFYFADPDGNRIQIVSSDGGTGIDHVGVQASDMEWEEAFFVDRLGFPVDHRVGWNTADFVRAHAWAEGKEEMAPGTRRMDRRYRDNPGAKPGEEREVPRPNVQIFLGLGEAVCGIFLATRFEQEPPPEQSRGTPRTAIAVDEGELEGLAEAVSATGAAVEGPAAHAADSPLAASVYFRDPCGNFFEYCSSREVR